MNNSLAIQFAHGNQAGGLLMPLTAQIAAPLPWHVFSMASTTFCDYVVKGLTLGITDYEEVSDRITPENAMTAWTRLFINIRVHYRTLYR